MPRSRHEPPPPPTRRWWTAYLSSVLFGYGIHLIEGVALTKVRAEPTERVTHLTYAVQQR